MGNERMTSNARQRLLDALRELYEPCDPMISGAVCNAAIAAADLICGDYSDGHILHEVGPKHTSCRNLWLQDVRNVEVKR